MTEILTLIFALMVLYNLFKWLGATKDRRRQYRYYENGMWIGLWVTGFTVTDWISPSDAAAERSEQLDTRDFSDNDSGCGGCGD